MMVITHRNVRTNGVELHVAEAGQEPLMVLLHGFPELWYSWRHQLPALAAAGYHAVAPDVRGYGRSTVPGPISAYTMRELTNDIVGLIDTLGEDTAVLVGHDWGAAMAWSCAQRHPQRVAGVAGLTVPLSPRPPAPITQLTRQAIGDRFNWMLYFAQPGLAEAELEADIARSLRLIFYALSGDAPDGLARHLFMELPGHSRLLDPIPEPGQLPAWLTEDDLAYYTTEFEHTGFAGALNRYRSIERDWHESEEVPDHITMPALFLGGEHDTATKITDWNAMRALASHLREAVVIPGSGHWIQQERPDDVNHHLLQFLQTV